MTMEIPMRRVGGSLQAVDQIADEELRSTVKAGQDVMVTVRVPRNIRQHRLAWALAHKVADALDLHDREDAMDLMKIKARHVNYITDPKTGELWVRPKSIRFSSCSQEEFNRFFKRFIHIVVTELLDGVDKADLLHEIEGMVCSTATHARAA